MRSSSVEMGCKTLACLMRSELNGSALRREERELAEMGETETATLLLEERGLGMGIPLMLCGMRIPWFAPYFYRYAASRAWL